MKRGNRFTDMEGRTYGRLTVVSFSGIHEKSKCALWNCQCSCGATTIASGAALRQNNIKSCGCLLREHNEAQLISRIGQRFSKLIIIAKDTSHRKRWFVRCDCGNEKSIMYGNLTSGCTTSCGCWKAEGKYQTDNSGVPYGVSTRNTTLLGYKDGARTRSLSWNLTDEQFDILTKAFCFYCGAEPSNICKSNHNKGNFVYQGIDRIDNSLGYDIKNVVPCCRICNRAKDTMSKDEFYSWISKIYQRGIPLKQEYF